MRSVTCSGCGLVSWADGGPCKRCGRPLPLKQAHTPSPLPQSGGAPAYSAPQTKKRVGHAVASLTIGIVGFFSLGIFLIGSVVGTILGVVALKKESSEPAKYGGKGLAVAGIILNIVAVFTFVPVGIIAAIAIPNLLASRRAANESSAISTIRTIRSAEDAYKATAGAGRFGELTQLAGTQLIEPELSSGVKNGYHFAVVNNGSDYGVSATPLRPSTGWRSFYYASTDDQIHVRVGGSPATANDPSLDYYNTQTTRRALQPEPRGPAFIENR